MKLGVSTASLFPTCTTEEAVKKLNKWGVNVAEVFLESYCEYNKEFGEILKKEKGELQIHSVHSLTTQFEPQLYSIGERAKNDSFNILKGFGECASIIGAKYYTFHGVARLKKTAIKIDFERVAKITQEIIDTLSFYGVKLSYENVHWNYYNYVGFFSELKKRVPDLCSTLDIKQARQSGINYVDLIEEMGENISTVHLSDIDENGKMCLPGKGTVDFYDLFSRLFDKGFSGAALIEAYRSDYEKEEEILTSIDFLKEIRTKIN